jgi:hypothetical protein
MSRFEEVLKKDVDLQKMVDGYRILADQPQDPEEWLALKTKPSINNVTRTEPN